MNQPLVSWLMPVYNSEKYIRRAIDSMFNQTYENFNMIIIVDGCTDNTAVICEEYAARDNRVHIYYNEKNLGVAASLNRGLNLCDGKYIARMDSDDMSYPERLEKQVTFMEGNHEVGVLGTQCRQIGDTYSFISKYPIDNDDIYGTLLFASAFSHPSIMLRSELFRLNNWKYPLVPIEDHALWSSLISKIKMANLSEVLIDYYIHTDSTMFALCQNDRVNFISFFADNMRRILFNVFNIDISIFLNLLKRESMQNETNIRECLFDGVKLLSQVKLANDSLRIFRDKSLIQALNFQWYYIKQQMHLSLLTFGYDEFSSEILESAIAKIANITMGQKIIIYGTGKYCINIMDNIKDKYFFEIIAFCDSSKTKQGLEFYGKKIIAPEQLTEFDYDYICISSPSYEYEIKNQLISEFHIHHEKILNLLLNVEEDVEFYSHYGEV